MIHVFVVGYILRHSSFYFQWSMIFIIELDGSINVDFNMEESCLINQKLVVLQQFLLFLVNL